PKLIKTTHGIKSYKYYREQDRYQTFRGSCSKPPCWIRLCVKKAEWKTVGFVRIWSRIERPRTTSAGNNFSAPVPAQLTHICPHGNLPHTHDPQSRKGKAVARTSSNALVSRVNEKAIAIGSTLLDGKGQRYLDKIRGLFIKSGQDSIVK
ncbi:hypothetical protein I7I51_05375, partial [Histoplasma capsulatum]